MKEPKLNELKVDEKMTKKNRSLARKSKSVKITTYVDFGSLTQIKKLAKATGIPYQRLLNRILKEGLAKQKINDNRLERLEDEIEKIKKKLAA